jgi:hypothetical protein
MPLNKRDLGLENHEARGTDEQRQAYLQIEENLKEASRLLQEAKDLAERHDLTFYVSGLPLENGESVNDEGWSHSAC